MDFFTHLSPWLATAVAALIAGVVSNPTAYDPVTRPQAAKKRRNLVLQRMYEQGYITVVDRIKDGDVQLIFNTTEGWQSLMDSKSIRQAALAGKVPYYTTAAASVAAAAAISAIRPESLEVRSLQDYYGG